jgi:hypothetical protein
LFLSSLKVFFFKAWNVANGQKIQLFEPIDDSEITGLAFLDRKRVLISVGLSRKIAIYGDVTFDVISLFSNLLNK